MSELTAEERSALDAVLAVVGAAAASEFAPFMDGDRVDAFLGALAAVDPPLTVRPVGIDRERLARALSWWGPADPQARQEWSHAIVDKYERLAAEETT